MTLQCFLWQKEDGTGEPLCSAGYGFFSHNMIPWGLVVMFLSFFSGLGIFANIYLGVKGNELAWIYRPFRSFQHFEETQKAWGFWGGLVFGISMGAWALIFLLVIFSNF